MSSFLNPIVEARANRGMTLQNLGKALGLSKQYISRAEQGTYSGLNRDLIKFASGQLGISSREVVRRYENFQTITRRRTAVNLDPEILTRGTSIEPGNVIFSEWRSSYWPSVISFANGFCVHPEMARNYEDGITPAIPDPIWNALRSVDLIDSHWSELPKSPASKLQTPA